MTAGSSWSLGLFAATFFGVFFFLFSLVIVSTWMQKKIKNCSSQLTLMVLWEVVRIKTFSKFFDTKTYNVLPSLLIFDIWFYYHFWRTFLYNIYHILRNRKKVSTFDYTLACYANHVYNFCGKFLIIPGQMELQVIPSLKVVATKLWLCLAT